MVIFGKTMKPKIHRTRTECERAMQEMALRHINEAKPDYETHNVPFENLEFDAVSYTYNRYGVHLRFTIKYPEMCTVCGFTERRLDAKYGRNW